MHVCINSCLKISPIKCCNTGVFPLENVEHPPSGTVQIASFVIHAVRAGVRVCNLLNWQHKTRQQCTISLSMASKSHHTDKLGCVSMELIRRSKKINHLLHMNFWRVWKTFHCYETSLSSFCIKSIYTGIFINDINITYTWNVLRDDRQRNDRRYSVLPWM